MKGETAKISCSVSSNPEAEYSWTRPWTSINQEYKGDSTCCSTSSSESTLDSLTADSATGTLTIPNISKEDEGNYTCLASSMAGKLEASAFIRVNVKPVIDTLENVTVLEGVKSVSLHCEARGDPRPSIHWKKMGRKRLANNMDRVSVKEDIHTVSDIKVTSSTMTVFSPEPSDAGVYECKVVNVAGLDSKTAKLIVEFGPTFESQEMSVQWSWDQKPVSLSCLGETK